MDRWDPKLKPGPYSEQSHHFEGGASISDAVGNADRNKLFYNVVTGEKMRPEPRRQHGHMEEIFELRLSGIKQTAPSHYEDHIDQNPDILLSWDSIGDLK